MKTMILKLLLLPLILIATLQLNAEEIGLGIIIGSPTGLSFNYKTSNSNSIDAALAFDLNHDDVHLHSTYLWRYPKGISLKDLNLGWYWGLGLKFRSHEDRKNDEHKDDNYRFGPRASVGINYEFNQHPFELFIEPSIIMNLIPKTDLDVDFGIGIRYYF